MDLQISDADLKDPKSIVGLLNEWSDSDINNRGERFKNWSEAINFYAGNQWIRYDERARRHEPIPITDANSVLERPVTNHVLRWIVASVSRFTNKPSMIVDPNSEEMQDKTTAKICEVILDYLWEDLEKDEQYLEASLWATICGTVFRKSIKKNSDRIIDIPGGEKIPVKCVDTDIISPFQIAFDGLPQRWRDVKTIMQTQVRRVDDVKKQFEQDLPGYFPEGASELEEEEIVSNAMAYSEGLKNIVDGAGTYNLAGGSQGTLKNCLLYKEAYVEPSKKHPKGLMLCAGGGKLLYFGPSPYYYLEGKFWHPFTSWAWGTIPGSVWGMALASQLVKLNRRINSIDALMAYNRKTMAVPGYFVPSASGIPEGSFIGIPGQVKTYDETPGGGKPYAHQGMPLPGQVLDERAMIVQEGDRLALAGDIRSGENPSGVNTLGQLQILTEQADISQAKTVESWEKFLERSETLDLLNFKDCYQVPDEKMVKSFKRFSKDITESDWNSFTGNQIQDNATIRMEKGSTIAKSRILEQQMLMTMLDKGFFPEFMTDPYMRRTILEKFGMSQFEKDSNIDVKYAEKAIEMMLAGQYPPVLPEIHNPDIQLPVHMRYMKDPKFLEVDPKIKVLFERRRQELVAALVQAGPVAPPPDQMNEPLQGGGNGAPPAAAGKKDDLFGGKGLV